jgi:hypothetical protein
MPLCRQVMTARAATTRLAATVGPRVFAPARHFAQVAAAMAITPMMAKCS